MNSTLFKLHIPSVISEGSLYRNAIWACKYLQTWETARGFSSFSQALGVVSFSMSTVYIENSIFIEEAKPSFLEILSKSIAPWSSLIHAGVKEL